MYLKDSNKEKNCRVKQEEGMDGLNGWKIWPADAGIIEQDMENMLMYLKDSNNEKKLQSEAGGR
jgi:hypothetical protein